MAVRKKSKRTGRKGARKAPPSRKPTARRKARKATRRVARKRAAPSIRKSTRRKAVSGALAPALASPLKFIDEMAAPRCRSRIPVEIDIAGRRERGTIADMSSTGARIVGLRMDLPPGTSLRIHYSSGTTPVAAEVVRATADGFAVKILPR